MNLDERKRIVVEFLRAASAGRPRDLADGLFAKDAKHHNPYFPAGMDALLDAMAAAAKEAPAQELDVKRVIADGDLVAVHSHVRPKSGDPGIAVVHVFRFVGDRVVEFWDVGQVLPGDSPNADGAF